MVIFWGIWQPYTINVKWCPFTMHYIFTNAHMVLSFPIYIVFFCHAATEIIHLMGKFELQCVAQGHAGETWMDCTTNFCFEHITKHANPLSYSHQIISKCFIFITPFPALQLKGWIVCSMSFTHMDAFANDFMLFCNTLMCPKLCSFATCRYLCLCKSPNLIPFKHGAVWQVCPQW